MAQNLIRIGFIGLLIALSNAMMETLTFELEVNGKTPFNFAYPLNENLELYGGKLENEEQGVCPDEYPAFCPSGTGEDFCLAEEYGGKNVKFRTNNGSVTIHCKNLPKKNLLDNKVHKLYTLIDHEIPTKNRKKDDDSTVDHTKPSCKIGDDFYWISTKISPEEEKELSIFKGQMKNVRGKSMSIQCFGIKESESNPTSNFKTFLGYTALTTLVLGLLYVQIHQM